MFYLRVHLQLKHNTVRENFHAFQNLEYTFSLDMPHFQCLSSQAQCRTKMFAFFDACF